MSNPKCKGCGTTVYPVESIKALDATWHQKCLKCGVCNTRLSLTTLQSYDKMPYCRSHVPQVKHTVVAEDVMTAAAKEAQKVNSYSHHTQVTTQKGTGEKPSQTADDQSIQHARDAQQKASYARAEDVATHKGGN